MFWHLNIWKKQKIISQFSYFFLGINFILLKNAANFISSIPPKYIKKLKDKGTILQFRINRCEEALVVIWGKL